MDRNWPSELAAEVDALGRTRRERDLPDVIAAMVSRMLGVEGVMIFLHRRSDERLVLMACQGIRPLRRSPTVPEDGVVGEAVRCGRVVSRRNRPDLPPGSPLSWESKLVAAVPIRCGDVIRGVIAIGDGADLADPEPMLELLGSLAGLALLNARATGAQEAARRAADFDPLTGLRNKRSFHEHLDQVVAEAQESGETLSLLIFDVDHFKHYNDHHGHPAGDRVLVEIGRLVRSSFREGQDIAARFGGEEFVVIFPRTPKGRAFELADRFRRVVEEHEFPLGSTQPGGRLTVSGGVAGRPEDADDGEGLLRVADQWLYEAKRMSRNRVSLAQGAVGPRVLEITEHR